MTDDIHDFAALNKFVALLKDDLDRMSALLLTFRAEYLDEVAQTRDALNQLQRNQRFLYEKIAPVFAKHFPDDWKYREEFDRILGTEIKPEDIKPQKDTR